LEILGTQDKGRGQTQQNTQDKTRHGGVEGVKKSLKILKE